MSRTIRLFYEDAYIKEFDAKVLSCEKDGDRYKAVLDKTAFFPEEGGQSPDKGTLSGVAVLDVQSKGEVIYHYLAAPIPEGDTVHGIIDWERRFGFMQHHTGEHIFSGIVHDKYGYENVGFHLSDHIVTMDYSGSLSAEEVKEIEILANKAVFANLKVKAYFPPKEELAGLSYRSKKELTGDVRIVEVPGVDVCACCAPHVNYTGEIGQIKVMSRQSYKGGVRLSIACGLKALVEMQKKQEMLETLSKEFSAGEDEIITLVQKDKEKIKKLNYKISCLGEELLAIKAAMISEDIEDVYLVVNAADDAAMRKTVNALTEKHTGICAVFSGNDKDGFVFIAGSSTGDCREFAKKMREECGAKGGGTERMVQGNTPGLPAAVINNKI